MDSLSTFLNAQPFIALFLVVCLGYAVGKISIAGLSLGSGAVLFVGLAVGAIAPKAAPPGLVINIGLAMFVYGLGIRYGKDFFKGLASPFGIKANLLAAPGGLHNSIPSRNGVSGKAGAIQGQTP
jgi:putative transport protein